MNNSKFCIYIPDEPTGKRVKEIADKAGIENACRYLFSAGYTYGIKGKYWDFCVCGKPNESTEDSPELTLSEFESLFSTKEIVGYKAPHDMYDGGIKKGSIFRKTTQSGVYYFSHDPSFDGNRGIVKEIVEQWEPVYKEEEKVVICGGDEIKLSEECYTTKAGQQFYIEDIEGPLTELMHFFSQETKLAEIHNLLKPSI
jgi:hypothetical protein